MNTGSIWWDGTRSVNALFALAVGAELGLMAVDLRNGLAECQPGKNADAGLGLGMASVFWMMLTTQMRIRVLAALQTLREMPCAGRRVAVLGDMAELGAQTQRGA